MRAIGWIRVAVVTQTLALGAASIALAQTATPANTQTPTSSPTPIPSLDPAVCYSIGDDDGRLVRIAKSTGSETSIGLTGAGSIRALAAAPVGSALYAVDGGQFGSV